MSLDPLHAEQSIELTDELLEAAIDLAVSDAVEAHRRSGVPMVTWHDEKVVTVSPDEFLALAESHDSAGNSDDNLD